MGQPFYYSDEEDTTTKSSSRRGTENSMVPTVSAELGRNLIAGTALFHPGVQEHRQRENRLEGDDMMSADMLDVLQGLMYDFGGAQHVGDQYVEVADTNSESSEEGVFRRVQNRSERQQNGNNSNGNSSTVIQVTPALRRAQEVGESRLQMRLSSLWRHNTGGRESGNDRFRRDRMPGPYARAPRHHTSQRGIVRGRFQESANQQQQGQPSNDGQAGQAQLTQTQSISPSSYRRQRRRFGFIIPQS